VVFDFGGFDGLILNEFDILFISTVQTVENEIISIIDLPKQDDLKKHTYSKIA